jgi:uncharacterized protein YjbI with pentapeptide repeats
MSRQLIALFVIGIVQLSQAASPRPCMGQVKCSGKYSDGLKPSPAELAEILKQHAAWVKDVSVDGWQRGELVNAKLDHDQRRADLCDANLEEAQFTTTELTGADLIHANLMGAHMQGAHLNMADLSDANLEDADLTDAHLNHANLADANLVMMDLSGTDLSYADLSGADLIGAHLEGADLSYAHLSGAKLLGAHLEDANLEFDPDSAPKAPDVYDADLQLATFREQPAGLAKLRSEFKDLGMRTQENQLTYAIRRSELKRVSYPDDPTSDYVHSWFERYFNTIFFDWTCQYGMSPGRPLLIVAALVVILSIVYMVAQIHPGPNGGIWAVWDEHRIKQTEGSKEPQQLTGGFPSERSQMSILLLALYFSLLSALRIGWSGLNFGTWISRMQPREYELHATGWVRVISGIQSLISVYLVALAILTYFGTPFEY